MTCFALQYCNPCYSRNFLFSNGENSEDPGCLPFQEHCPHPAHFCFNASSLCSIFAVTGFFIPFVKFQAPICACAACIATQTGSCIAPIKTLSDAARKLASEVQKLAKEILGLQEVSEDIEQTNEKFRHIIEGIKRASDEMQTMIRQLEGHYVDFSEAARTFHSLSEQSFQLLGSNQELLKTLHVLEDFQDGSEVLNTLKALKKHLAKQKQATKPEETSSQTAVLTEFKAIYEQVASILGILQAPTTLLLHGPTTQSIPLDHRLPSEENFTTLDKELLKRNTTILELRDQLNVQKRSIDELSTLVTELKEALKNKDT